MATVSIIVPTYNRSKLLKECVESLLAQTYRDLEIHVVDDGSTDDTRETIGSIMSKHSRIKYSYRPHLGACAARNFGVEHYNMGNRKTSIAHFKKALSYNPFDLRLYINLLQALLINPPKERISDWCPLDDLGQPFRNL